MNSLKFHVLWWQCSKWASIPYRNFFLLLNFIPALTMYVWLRTGRPGDRGSIHGGGKKDFSCNFCVHTGSGAHPASCTMGTVGPFPGGKARPERNADHSPHLYRGVEWVEAIYSLPLRVHRCVVGLLSAFIYQYILYPFIFFHFSDGIALFRF
jgi:hypothetical protein